MMVGTVVVCLWRVLVRRQSPFSRRHCRRRAGRACHKTARQEASVAEEKASLMDQQDDLPAYKDSEPAPEPTKTAEA
jgi:hypothetical protein